MTCNKAIDTYMALDKHEPVPLTVIFHILQCKKCRSLIRAMTKASDLYAKRIASAKNFDGTLTEKTMLKIHEAVAAMQADSGAKLPEVRIFPWVITGIIMIIGFSSLPFTHIGRWAAETFGLAFTIPFALIFAVFVSVFSALFVGKNLDFFIKKFDLNRN